MLLLALLPQRSQLLPQVTCSGMDKTDIRGGESGSVLFFSLMSHLYSSTAAVYWLCLPHTIDLLALSNFLNRITWELLPE